MGWAILLFFLFVLVFTFLFRWSNVIMGSAVGKSVYKRHKAAEHLMASDALPREWRGLYRRQQGNFRIAIRPRTDPEREDADKRKARAAAVEQVEDLINYFEKAPVFDSPETRRTVLERLRQVKSLWEQLSWDELSAINDTD